MSNDGRKVSATVLFLSAIMYRKVRVNFVFFSAIFAGPRSAEIQKFCYHGNVTQRCHGIKMCYYVCLRQLPSFSYQIIKGSHFYAAVTTTETTFMSEGHSVIDWEMKNLRRPVTDRQVLFTNETNIFR